MAKPVKLADPAYCPGTYALDLYCDHNNPAHGFHEFPHEFSGYETGGQTRSAARKAGWKLHRDGTATCPKCVAALNESSGNG